MTTAMMIPPARNLYCGLKLIFQFYGVVVGLTAKSEIWDACPL